MSPTDLPQPGKGEHRSLQINTTVPSITPGDPRDNTITCSLTGAMTAERYSEEAWVHVYTDGSATDAVTSGGAGVHVRFPEGEVQSASIPAGKYCSNYMAAIQALVQATSVVRDSSNECQQVVLSDALSVLEATAGDKLPRPSGNLQGVAQHKPVVLQWLPVHAVFQEMKKADELAKLGAKGRQQDNSVTFQERKTLIRAALGQGTEG